MIWTEIEPRLWSAALRMAQALVWASPYLLIGVCAAGVLGAMVSPTDLRRAFDEPGWRSRARLWLLAVLLPWGSFGALPVARQLRRAGVRPSGVLLFLLAAPVVNPLTVAYAFSVMPRPAAMIFVGGALALPLMAALLSGRWLNPLPKPSAPPAEVPMADQSRRVPLALICAARELTGPLLRDLLIGLIGVGLLAAIVPGDVLEHTLAHPGWLAPLLAAVVAVPAYLSPPQGIMVAAVAYSEGNSLGAAFVLLLLGVGVNFGWIAWAGANLGRRRILLACAILIGAAVLYGYAADAALPHLRTSLNHHHALTDLGPVDDPGSGIAAFDRVRSRVIRESATEPVALGALALLAAIGMGVRSFDRRGQLDRWFTAPPVQRCAGTTPRWWARPMSARASVAALALCAVALAVAGLYVYFPSPDLLVEDLRYAATDAYVSGVQGDRQQAIERLDKVDRLIGKVSTSVLIRHGPLDANCFDQSIQLRDRAKAFRAAIASGTSDQIKTAGVAFHQTLHDLHRAYDGLPSAGGNR